MGGATLESAKEYGYVWADWLYGYDKDAFMVDVYNDCKDIDDCADPTERAAKLLFLRNKIKDSKKSWIDGIVDFIEFESQLLVSCSASPLSASGSFSDVEEFEDACGQRPLAILDAAYRHGAFNGLCRTASGAEWIGQLGEFCAAAIHQGFKWVRVTGGVADWELPSLGEQWCKGAVMWGLVAMYVAVDVAGADAGNDAALERIHAVIGAHHWAGCNWLKYRGPHPHKWWSREVRGRAPDEVSIRSFGQRHCWPQQMIDVLSRAASHVNTWVNPPFDPAHQERMRGLLVGHHTPRLQSRLTQVVRELVQLEDDVTASEAGEMLSRSASWQSNATSHWRARGDCNDRVYEVGLLGAALGVLRESRNSVSVEFLNRASSWTRQRIAHLPLETQDFLMTKVLRTIQVRGRIPGASSVEYSSSGSGPLRFVDGFWDAATWCAILSHPSGGKEVPDNMRQNIMRCFNWWSKKRRVIGKDVPPDPKDNDGCPVCVGDSIWTGLVDNRPPVGMLMITTWGILLYHNLGLGRPEDVNLGCIGAVKSQGECGIRHAHHCRDHSSVGPISEADHLA